MSEKGYLQTKKLCVGYQKHIVVDNIEISLEQGEILTLIGPNGAGKSTVLKSIARQLETLGGSIYLDQKELSRLSGQQLSQSMAVVMTQKLRAEKMTCEDVVATGRYPYTGRFGILSSSDWKVIKEAMELVQVTQIKDLDFNKISDGQRQRVMLARAICQEPQILILDEPTAQLDPAARKDFLVMLQKLHKEFGLTIILTSHNLEDVMEMSDECVILDDGKVIEQGNPKEVARHLQKIHHPLEQSLPQILRLEEKFQIELTFSMEEAREQIRKKEYQLIKKTHFEGKTVLSISHLYAGYEKGKDVLSNLSVEVKEGEIFAAVGANGSGKSTLLSCMVKQMKFDGKLKCKKKIVYMPQDPTLLFVKDQLFEDLLEMGKEKEVKIDKLLDMADLMREKKSHPYDLSGGQQQMAALIKVLLADPEILLLDEPTKGMDREHSRKFGELLRKLTDQGKTIFIVSHDLEFCAEYADRVGMMFDGKIEGIAEPSKFFAQNYFYTTECAKITRDFEKVIILPQEVVSVC